eukprot:TRINITY_DN870_c0_g1_i1.p1 TRINITY_DN870_c0_g1~~TRINITY_DN870_c0_g1_i1.p1  ORF type:complete len:424 (+),score=128.65 TRINITY_DN870_c0_g1_i1:215-1486(+)
MTNIPYIKFLFLQGYIGGFLPSIFKIQSDEDTVNMSVKILTIMKSIICNIFSTINKFGVKYIISSEKYPDIEHLINFLKKDFKSFYSLEKLDFIFDALIEKSLKGEHFDDDLNVLSESLHVLIFKASNKEYSFTNLNTVEKWKQLCENRISLVKISEKTKSYYLNALKAIEFLFQYFSNPALLSAKNNNIPLLEELKRHKISLPQDVLSIDSQSIYEIPSIVENIVEYTSELSEISRAMTEIDLAINETFVDNVNILLLDISLHAYAILQFIKSSTVLSSLYCDTSTKNDLPAQFEMFHEHCFEAIYDKYLQDSDITQNFYHLFEQNEINESYINQISKEFEVTESVIQSLNIERQYMEEQAEKGDFIDLIHFEDILGEDIVMECVQHVMTGGNIEELDHIFEEEEKRKAYEDLIHVLQDWGY